MDEHFDFEDFRQQMWLGVHEGAFLFELPFGAKDHTPDGIVKHGPWPPEQCSRCLLTWFDHGWVALSVLAEHLDRWAADGDALSPDPDDDTALIVERDRARTILVDPRAWTNDRAEGLIIVHPTAHASTSGFRNLWLDAIKPGR